MEKIKWRLLPAFVLVILAVMLFIPSMQSPVNSEGPPEIRYLIGMSQNHLLDPWRVATNMEIEEAAEGYPGMRVIFADAAGDIGRQEDDILRMVQNGVDLLVISCPEMEKLAEVIEDVVRDTPVILLEQSIDSGDYTMFIGADNVEMGRMAAQMLIDDMDGSGRIIEVVGDMELSIAKERQEGFYSVIDANPNVDIETTLQANWMRDQAEDRMMEYIVVNNPEYDGVFAQNDTMADGVSITNAKLWVGVDVPIVGIGGVSGPNGGLELVEKGILSGTVHCPTGGKEAIEYAVKILDNVQDIPKDLVLEPQLIR